MVESKIVSRYNHLLCYNCNFGLAYCPNCGAHIQQGQSIVERCNQEISNMHHFCKGEVLIIKTVNGKTIEIEIDKLDSISIRGSNV